MAGPGGSWQTLSGVQKAAVLLGVPAAATVGYILYRRYREAREAPLTYVGDEGLELEVRVPRGAMRSLIGRRGSTINQLRRETGAQIAVREAEEGEDPEEGALVRIWGSPARACRAKAAVLSLVADCAPVAEELRVPGRAVGRIIGRGGETVRGIRRISGARVECGRDPESSLAPLRVIQISGTRREVEAAKRLILEKLSEDAAFRRDLAQAAASRCPRKQPLGSRRDPEPRPEPLPAGTSERWDVEWWEGTIPGQRDGSEGTEELELGKEELELGKEELELGNEEPEDGNEEPELGKEEPELGKELEELENRNEEVELGMELKELENGNEELENGNEEPENGNEELENGNEEPEEPPVEKFEVPSPDLSFPADEQLEVFVSAAENPGHFWVQLLGGRSLQLDKLTREMGLYYGSTHPCPPVSVRPGDIVAAPYPGDGQWYRARVLAMLDNGHWDLYYVDFGDNGEAPREALRPLRGDFLSLPFQAIECSLAGIVPSGNDWEEAALEAFERLTGCAQWRPLEAQLCSFCPASPWPRPSLRLFARHHGQRLDVGAELVRLGFAIPGPPEDDLGPGSQTPPAQDTPDSVTSTASLVSDPPRSAGDTPDSPSCRSLPDATSPVPRDTVTVT